MQDTYHQMDYSFVAKAEAARRTLMQYDAAITRLMSMARDAKMAQISIDGIDHSGPFPISAGTLVEILRSGRSTVIQQLQDFGVRNIPN